MRSFYVLLETCIYKPNLQPKSLGLVPSGSYCRCPNTGFCSDRFTSQAAWSWLRYCIAISDTIIVSTKNAVFSNFFPAKGNFLLIDSNMMMAKKIN